MLLAEIEAYVSRRGSLYAPLSIPDFQFPTVFGNERVDAVLRLMPDDCEKIVDLGAHWGEVSQLFAATGRSVLAFEKDAEYLRVLRLYREYSARSFEIADRDFLDERPLVADGVIAFNIFHHFLKSEEIFVRFSEWLGNLQCSFLAVQLHSQSETQMQGAYRNYGATQFVSFLSEKTGLEEAIDVGRYDNRPVHVLRKPA